MTAHAGLGSSIHQAWSAGKAARNAWITIPDAYLVETVAARGEVEAVTLDLQHGLFDTRSAIDSVRAIALHGKAPLVRLPDGNPGLIGFLLDAGVTGLIAPMVESVDEIERMVSACRYAPAGRRSYGPTRATLAVGADAFALAEQSLLFAMVESRRGLERCEALAAVEGLSGLFVGPGDLGLSLGLGPGQDREEPEIRAALERVVKVCREAGKRCAVHAGGASYAAKMAAAGFDLVTVWVDAVAIVASLAEAASIWTQQARG
jgi:4-hydroxy-2-oxoheptanedioate aldolase